MPHRHPPPPRYELHPQLAADTHPIAALALCELRLMDDANYPWLVLVPRLPKWNCIGARRRSSRNCTLRAP